MLYRLANGLRRDPAVDLLHHLSRRLCEKEHNYIQDVFGAETPSSSTSTGSRGRSTCCSTSPAPTRSISAKISILALAEQFLAYLQGVQARQLQIAAEYLVMAAWLAYLKSQLLLPPAERELTDAEAMAEDLGERLRRLEALRRAAAALQERPRLGEARFARGAPEAPVVVVTPLWRTSLVELFGAYGAADAARPHDQHDHAGAAADDAGGGAAAAGAAADRAGLARPRLLPARGPGRPAACSARRSRPR